MKKCFRGHSLWHQVMGSDGKVFCDYILGNVGVESGGFRTILCCDVPKGDPMPAGMLPISNI